MGKLQKLIGFWIFVFFLTAGVSAQELNCTVKVNSAKIQYGGEKQLFKTLEKTLYQFVNGQKWTDFRVGDNEKILCNINLDIQEWDQSTNYIKSYLSIQARRPVFNSSYTTNVLNVVDREVNFTFNEQDVLQFSENTVASNLVACVAYYCYVMLGVYFDTFMNRGGELFFDKAQNIVNIAYSFSELGWKPTERNSKNRYWIIENYTNGNYGVIHDVLYEYHRLGIDMMYDDPETGRKNIVTALEKIKILNELKTGLACKQFFMEVKASELVEIFRPTVEEEKQKVYQLLKEIDPSNLQKYDQIVKGGK